MLSSLRPGTRLLLLCLACAAGLVPCAPAAAQSGASGRTAVSTESRVKAAYLFKLRNYVELAQGPAGAGNYVIGIVGADEVADELVKIATATAAAGTATTVRRLRAGDSLEGVNALFIGEADWPNRALVERAQARHILLVSDDEGALQQGAVVNFLLQDERVRFEVSIESANRAGLKLDSRLLALATTVIKARNS